MRTILLQLSVFALCVFSNAVNAQDVVVTNLSPSFGQISANQFSLVSITNTSSAPVRGQIISILRDLSGEVVAELRSYTLTLAAGQTMSSADINWPRRMTYGSSAISRAFSRSGVLGFGDFNLCSQFVDLDGTIRGQQCQERKSTPLVQFSLVFPHHKSEIANDRPVLSWENVGQYGVTTDAMRYEVRLTELLAEQSVAEALETNPLLLHRKGLRQNSLLYPMGARPLLPGRTYAWTVTVFRQNQPLLDAQQWFFTVADNTPTDADRPAQSFAMLDTRINNRAYLFDNELRVGFDNNEGLESIAYRIIDLDNRGREVKNTVPPPTLSPGLNTLAIPVKDLKLNTESLYQLEVKTARGQLYFLQFRIKS